MKRFHSPINKSISLFLAFILTAGTLTAFFLSSSSVTDAYAISDVKKDEILCNNINFNLNDLDVDSIPEPLSSLLQDQAETENTDGSTGTIGNGENRFGYDKDFSFICKNNNNNTLIVSPTSPPSQPPCNVTVDTISGIFNPVSIAYDSANERMYVGSGSGTLPTNPLNSTVYVIDTTTNTVIDTILVGNGAISIAYDSANERMYVVILEDDSVYVIDTTTNTVIDTITVGDAPFDIAYDPVNKRMYVTNSDSDDVSVIDTITNTVIDTITVGFTPVDIAYDPVNHRMYVPNSDTGTNTVSVINLCPRTAELQQEQQSTNDIIATTANNNNDDTMIKNIIQHQDIPTKDITINNNIIEQEEEQKLADEQKIQRSNVMSPPSLPKNTIQVGNFY